MKRKRHSPEQIIGKLRESPSQALFALLVRRLTPICLWHNPKSPWGKRGVLRRPRRIKLQTRARSHTTPGGHFHADS